MLATIWSQVDTLLPKKIDEKPANTHICRECLGIKLITREGLPHVRSVVSWTPILLMIPRSGRVG
jgi:hypothetical protein